MGWSNKKLKLEKTKSGYEIYCPVANRSGWWRSALHSTEEAPQVHISRQRYSKVSLGRWSRENNHAAMVAPLGCAGNLFPRGGEVVVCVTSPSSREYLCRRRPPFPVPGCWRRSLLATLPGKSSKHAVPDQTRGPRGLGVDG